MSRPEHSDAKNKENTAAGKPERSDAKNKKDTATGKLELSNVTTGYLETPAIDDISLHVSRGEICAIIGTNGAGKTTTLRTISGVLKPWRGTVTLEGTNISRWSPSRIVRAGIAQSPEGRRILPELSVDDNLAMGAYTISGRGLMRQLKTRVLDLFPLLKTLLPRSGGTLSGGEQQMLAISRSLMSQCKYLLLDEPSMGLAPVIVERIFDLLPVLRKDGLGILLVEQNATAALDIADRAYVLDRGKIVLAGPAETLRHDNRIQEAYLGV